VSVDNAELAAVFREVGFVLQYQGEGWYKVRSYLTFADLLDELEGTATAMTDAELKALPGVGKAIFSKTRDYQTRGTFNLLDRVRTVPASIRAMLAAGLPPAAVRALEEECSITSLDALRAAHTDGSLLLGSIPARQRGAVRDFLA
jgi:DNA polymerase/3'-5' exonuclease PolX